MCTKKRPPISKGSAEGADKDTADTIKALTAALETSQKSLKVDHLTHPCLMCSHCALGQQLLSPASLSARYCSAPALKSGCGKAGRSRYCASFAAVM